MPAVEQPGARAPLEVLEAATVVVGDPQTIAGAVAVPESGLRQLAETVALSSRGPVTVRAALRRAGIPLADDAAVRALPSEPALPMATEEAVGPRAVRALFQRAVVEARQVRLDYFPSSRGGAATDRVVDPWSFADDLLVGYCHLRQGERTFAVDRVGRARLLPARVDHPAPQLAEGD